MHAAVRVGVPPNCQILHWFVLCPSAARPLAWLSLRPCTELCLNSPYPGPRPICTHLASVPCHVLLHLLYPYRMSINLLRVNNSQPKRTLSLSLAYAWLFVVVSQAKVAALRSELLAREKQMQQEREGQKMAAAPAEAAGGATPTQVRLVTVSTA